MSFDLFVFFPIIIIYFIVEILLVDMDVIGTLLFPANIWSHVSIRLASLLTLRFVYHRIWVRVGCVFGCAVMVEPGPFQEWQLELFFFFFVTKLFYLYVYIYVYISSGFDLIVSGWCDVQARVIVGHRLEISYGNLEESHSNEQTQSKLPFGVPRWFT